MKVIKRIFSYIHSMKKLENIIGKKVNRFTIIAEAPKRNTANRRVIVQCECGNQKDVVLGHVLSGRSKSCGCLQKEVAAKVQTTHGLSKTRLSYVWQDMKKRCCNPNGKAYKDYGGRGITVCDEWLNDFSAFAKWALDNGYADNLQLDRENNNGNYEPSNCRFVTRLQNKMNRRNTIYLELNGIRKTMVEWAEVLGIKYKVLKDRYTKLGWDDVKTLTTPPKTVKRYG